MQASCLSGWFLKWLDCSFVIATSLPVLEVGIGVLKQFGAQPGATISRPGHHEWTFVGSVDLPDVTHSCD
jgi:hypothetical protein